MGDFGSKYDKTRHNKDSGRDPANRNKFNRHQETNAIVKSAVDEIILQENQKVIYEKGAHENIESDFDWNKTYQIYNMSLKKTREKV